MWWMPWRLQAMKDVIACDKLRGAGKLALIRRFPNGETHRKVSHTEYIGMRGEPGELKHLSSSRKDINRDSESSGERNRNSLHVLAIDLSERNESPAIAGDSPVRKKSVVEVGVR